MSKNQLSHSGLEVVQPELEVVPGSAPEVLHDKRPPEVVPDDEGKEYYERQDNFYTTVAQHNKRPLICGLQRKTFWITFGVAAVLVVAAVAGGAAGGVKSNRNDTVSSSDGSDDVNATAASSSTASSSPPPTSTAPISTTAHISTATIALPSITILRDCPSSNNTLYSAYLPAVNGPLTFRKFCKAGLKHVLNGNDVLNESKQSLNDCIDACANYNYSNRTAIALGDNQTCNAVCWRSDVQLNNINQIPGQCFGFTTGNSSAGFEVTDEPLCDSAGWINQRDL